MQYSSALWTEDTPDLEAAQALKLNRVVELLDLSGGESVLEIGCGWGSLATRLAETEGAGVTAITLSPAQLAFARARATSRGCDRRVDFRLLDYRDVSGRFDRVVSIEMLEAVGEARWPRYFQTVAKSLKAGGRAVLQTITIDEAYYEHYRRNPDFIQKHVFPGGFLPSKAALEGGIAGGRAPKLRIVLRANARRMAYALPFTLAGGGRPRLRRSIPPSVGLLPRLLRGRLRGRDDRRHAPFDRPPPTGRRERRITERQMLTRRSVFWLVAALAAAPPVPAAAFEFRPYDEAAAQKAIASGAPVVIHVYAPWCLQCHIQASILDGLDRDGPCSHGSPARGRARGETRRTHRRPAAFCRTNAEGRPHRPGGGQRRSGAGLGALRRADAWRGSRARRRRRLDPGGDADDVPLCAWSGGRAACGRLHARPPRGEGTPRRPHHRKARTFRPRSGADRLRSARPHRPRSFGRNGAHRSDAGLAR